MRIDFKKYRESNCRKCKQYTGDKLVFGKCATSKEQIHKCVERELVWLAMKNAEHGKLIEELRHCAENADIDMCKDCRWHTKDEVNCIDLLLLEAAKALEEKEG